MQEELSEIAAVQRSRTVNIGDLTSEIRAKAVRHVTMQNTREHPLEQKLNLHQVGDPIKRHTDLFKYGYIPDV